jgi:hypothetical protein
MQFLVEIVVVCDHSVTDQKGGLTERAHISRWKAGAEPVRPCHHFHLTDFSVGFFAFLAPPSMTEGLASFLGRISTEGSRSHRVDVLGVGIALPPHLRLSELLAPGIGAIKNRIHGCAMEPPHSLSQLSLCLPSPLLSMPSAATAAHSTLEGGCVELFAWSWCQRPVRFEHTCVGEVLGHLRGAPFHALLGTLPHSFASLTCLYFSLPSSLTLRHPSSPFCPLR